MPLIHLEIAISNNKINNFIEDWTHIKIKMITLKSVILTKGSFGHDSIYILILTFIPLRSLLSDPGLFENGTKSAIKMVVVF